MRCLLPILLVLMLVSAPSWAQEPPSGGFAVGEDALWDVFEAQPSLEAALVVEALARRNGLLSRLTPPPSRSRLSLALSEGAIRADLYQGEAPPLAALVLIPGAEPQGIENPLLVSLAETLARVRFTVLVPEIPGLCDLQLRPGDIAAIRGVFEQALSLSSFSAAGVVGIGAISYSVGPAVLAALDPAVGQRAAFFFGIGGYYDLQDVITFFATGEFEARGGMRCHLEPNVYGKWVFINSMIPSLERASDRMTFEAMVRRKLEDLDAPIDDLARRLSPQARVLYELATVTDPRRLPSLVARLPSGVRASLARLDLAQADLSGFRPSAILLHSRGDDIIPYPQSVELAAALPRAEVFLADFGHVEIESLQPDEALPVLKALDALLRQRRSP